MPNIPISNGTTNHNTSTDVSSGTPELLDANELDTFGMKWYALQQPFQAIQMNQPFTLVLPGGVRVNGVIGDWLIRDPVTDERIRVTDDEFQRMYKPIGQGQSLDP